MLIKEIRKQKGLTTNAVAKRLGVSQGYYSQLENGKRSFSEFQLSQLAGLLEIPEKALHAIALSVTEDSAFSGHWISNLPVNGIPLKAWLSHTGSFSSDTIQQFQEALILSIKESIGTAMSIEFSSNPQLLKYLFQRAKGSSL
jgi:transcriptional regulator with XRE-family HTH domain